MTDSRKKLNLIAVLSVMGIGIVCLFFSENQVINRINNVFSFLFYVIGIIGILFMSLKIFNNPMLKDKDILSNRGINVIYLLNLLYHILANHPIFSSIIAISIVCTFLVRGPNPEKKGSMTMEVKE